MSLAPSFLLCWSRPSPPPFLKGRVRSRTETSKILASPVPGPAAAQHGRLPQEPGGQVLRTAAGACRGREEERIRGGPEKEGAWGAQGRGTAPLLPAACRLPLASASLETCCRALQPQLLCTRMRVAAAAPVHTRAQVHGMHHISATSRSPRRLSAPPTSPSLRPARRTSGPACCSAISRWTCPGASTLQMRRERRPAARASAPALAAPRGWARRSTTAAGRVRGRGWAGLGWAGLGVLHRPYRCADFGAHLALRSVRFRTATCALGVDPLEKCSAWWPSFPGQAPLAAVCPLFSVCDCQHSRTALDPRLLRSPPIAGLGSGSRAAGLGYSRGRPSSSEGEEGGAGGLGLGAGGGRGGEEGPSPNDVFSAYRQQRSQGYHTMIMRSAAGKYN